MAQPPGNLRPAAVAARRAVAQVAQRTTTPVSATCDRCGRLSDPTDANGLSHVVSYPAHAVTVQTLVTAIYRHPTRVPATPPEGS